MSYKITKESTLEEIATLVCEALKNENIDVVLVGGAVVSIYSVNEYMSYDLDFVVLGIGKKVSHVMEKLGFVKGPGRHFIHPKTKFYVEFPGSTVAIGASLDTEIVERKSAIGKLKLLSPTDCTKDRLASYYHWNDQQALDQAIAVAKRHPVSMKRIKEWSLKEGMKEKFETFLKRYKEMK